VKSSGVSSNKIITNVRKGHLATDESSCLGVIRCSAAARQKKKKDTYSNTARGKKKKTYAGYLSSHQPHPKYASNPNQIMMTRAGSRS
jgi:hypothetical protein